MASNASVECIDELLENTVHSSDLIKDTNKFSQFLKKLKEIIKKNDKLNLQTNLAEYLNHLLNIIEENKSKSYTDRKLLKLIEELIAAILADYKKLRYKLLTLRGVNDKIRKELNKQSYNKAKIGDLIIKCVNEKINDPNEDLEQIQSFYIYFIDYVSFIREAFDENLDEGQYSQHVEHLQSILLMKKNKDIRAYFQKLISSSPLYQATFIRYSIQILLNDFIQDENVLVAVSNQSEFFQEELSKIFEDVSKLDCDATKLFYLKLLFKLCYSLTKESYQKLVHNLVNADLTAEKFLQLFYEVTLSLYMENLNTAQPKETQDKAKNNLLKRIRLFFIEVKSKNLLHNLSELVTRENHENHFKLLCDLYGKRVQLLDFKGDSLLVKYVYDERFFDSLNSSIHEFDVPNFDLYANLIFYINVYDYSKACTCHPVNLTQYQHVLINSKYKQSIQDMIDILRVMINIGSADFRVKLVESILHKLELDPNVNVKSDALKVFFTIRDDEKSMCFRLVESFNIHLLVDIYGIQAAEKLSEFNKNYCRYLNEMINLEECFRELDLENLIEFENEFKPGMSIPYYLSSQLPDEEDLEELSTMPFLFKIFNCSTDLDKKEFLVNKPGLIKEFIKLKKSISLFLQFYGGIHENKEFYEDLLNLSIIYILQGFNYNSGETLAERNEYARIIIENFINYKTEFLDHILKSHATEIKGEILNTFNEVMKRTNKSLEGWTTETSKIGDKIYFMYCYLHYSQHDFDTWFKELNNENSFKQLNDLRGQIISEFQLNRKVFNSINIKYLQHNQIGALALIEHHLMSSNKENLFIKIGTGQGKSLTIAETARKIILKSRETEAKKQVFVITCYDHLAERDHQNYKKYFENFRIKSGYVTRASSTNDILRLDVVYVDLETYFDVLRKDSEQVVKKKNAAVNLPDYSNSVLIMDEFDSLILDSDDIKQTVTSFRVEEKIDVASKSCVKKFFGKEFIDNLEKKFPKIFEDWFNYELKELKNQTRRSRQINDSLGKTKCYTDPFLTVLGGDDRCALLVNFFLDPLSFYSKFEQVIGFSGTITTEGIRNFSDLFDKKESIFYDIPPFFGTKNLENNRMFVNRPGYIATNIQDYLEQIISNIEKRHKTQPVLIFAESTRKQGEEQSEYEMINEEIKKCKDRFMPDTNFYNIETEADIKKNLLKLGKLGTITLATRIIARGADIKVDKSVKQGLHLVITYYPDRENIYEQMLGRTARQDEPGTYAIITRNEKNFIKTDSIVVNKNWKILHEISEYYFKNVKNDFIKENELRWPVFMTLLMYSNVHLVFDELKDFVDKNLLN